MRKLKRRRKFSRKRDQRKAFLRSLLNSFFLKEKIKTTEARAKEILIYSQKCITRAKKGDLNSRRILAKDFSKETVKKLMDDLGPRYKERQGGYARVIKLGPRQSNSAKMAIIEFVK